MAQPKKSSSKKSTHVTHGKHKANKAHKPHKPAKQPKLDAAVATKPNSDLHAKTHPASYAKRPKSKKTAVTTLLQRASGKPRRDQKKTQRALKEPTKLQRIVASKTFSQLFAMGSACLLFVSVIFWSLLSARIQLSNADQLSDASLFQNAATFKGATFPSAHTFLLKWPLFWLMHLLGNSVFVFAMASTLLAVLTVAVLVFILYRIERRPVVFGCLCLALASILLLVPAQPYPGALLPVNMAMTTTRNIEYAVYIASLYLLLRAQRLRSVMFVAGCVLMVLLAASDKLFMVLAVGGAVVALVAHRLFQWRKPDTRPVLRALVGSLVSAILATLLISLIARLHFTHIASEGAVSPYGLINSPKQFVEGVAYGIGAFLTNLGANPVHGLRILKNGPHELAGSLLQISIIPYTYNLLLACFGLFSVYKVMHRGRHDGWATLSVALIWSSMVALGVFIFTDHYYPVDARYVGIVLFAAMIAMATYTRERKLTLRFLYKMAMVTIIVLPFGVISAWHEYQQGRQALSVQDNLSHSVAAELHKQHISSLVGDYWAVYPIKVYADKNFTVLPVKPCNVKQSVLTSSVWYKGHRNKPIAFLATRDNALDKYEGCTFQQIHTLYGDATTTRVLNGSSSDPRAILFTYAGGFGHLAKHNNPVVTYIPTPPENAAALTPLPATCAGKTSVNISAHQDDDLLFMSPDVLNDIHDGHCIVSVYVTSGDAGQGQSYRQSREAGAEAAYSFMYAAPNKWLEKYAHLNNHLVTLDTLASNQGIELIFMHLPDGGLHGEGFNGTGDSSIGSLRDGSLPSITSEDGLATYSRQDMIDFMLALYNVESPSTIRTLNYSQDLRDGDHNDHHATGYFAQEAFKNYEGTAVLKAYSGYPMKQWPVSIHDGNAVQKLLTFLVYAQHDPAVCQTIAECRRSDTYGSYLQRQYSRVVATHQQLPGAH
jgi:LmbE family N-acetylglucosaminyl deacetylase